MLLRLAVFGMMALGIAGFGTVAWLALRPPEMPMEAAVAELAPPPPPARHAVLAAAQPLRAGTLLKPEDLLTVEVPVIPLGAQQDTAAIRAGLVGAMLRRSLAANETLLAPDVMRTSDHGFLAAVLAPDRRAASVAVDAVSGSAGLIWPGDHVDLILTQALEDPTLPAAHKVVAETVLMDVRVIAIDQLLAHGVAPSEQANLARTVTLEVTAADAGRIAVATRLGKLSLAVRAAEETNTGEPPRMLTTWGGDVSPALGKPAPPAAQGATMKLYQGNADGKEIRF
jgi:pilus assembly protein CpaB